jgi:hypothetical protein
VHSVFITALTPSKEALVRSLVSVLVSVAALFATIALAACTDTYHPEYHPVTVTQFSQNVAYPGNAPQAFITPPPQPVEPPPGFFEHP